MLQADETRNISYWDRFEKNGMTFALGLFLKIQLRPLKEQEGKKVRVGVIAIACHLATSQLQPDRCRNLGSSSISSHHLEMYAVQG